MIEPDTRRVLVSQELEGTDYAKLHGSKANLPADPALAPQSRTLAMHVALVGRKPFIRD